MEAGPPSGRIVANLSELLESESALQAFAQTVSDDRFAPAGWLPVLRRELLQVLAWAARRHARPASGVPQRLPERALCLLPRRAICLHLLRRALPFAACGTHTFVSAPADVQTCAESVLSAIAEVLGIREWLTMSSGGPPAIDRLRGYDAVIFTGRRRNASLLRAELGPAFLGATGRCGVLIGTREEELTAIGAGLRSHHVPHSCSRLRARFLLAEDRRGQPADATFAILRQEQLLDALQRLHPSIVLLAPSLHERRPPLGGYCGLPCDARGAIGLQTGFGADPAFGWPGDYVL